MYDLWRRLSRSIQHLLSCGEFWDCLIESSDGHLTPRELWTMTTLSNDASNRSWSPDPKGNLPFVLSTRGFVFPGPGWSFEALGAPFACPTRVSPFWSLRVRSVLSLGSVFLPQPSRTSLFGGADFISV